jgi:hypothetical protein
MKMELLGERLEGTIRISPEPCPLAEPVPEADPTARPQKPPLTGKYLPISYFRRLVIDLMHFSAKVPSATVERRMSLARLIAARRACARPPTWSTIFTKAFAVVSARTPLLRTSYLSFPWSRFYEHATNIATLNVDRLVAGERIVLYAHARDPELCSLRELEAVLNAHRYGPVSDLPSYRNAARLSRVPWPFRRLLWWAALNLFGSVRCHHFGTFGISSLGAMGAGITRLTPLLTAQLHYGMFDDTGKVDMRLSFDHRVLDGATAAVALAGMEEVLLSEMSQECADWAQDTTVPGGDPTLVA